MQQATSEHGAGASLHGSHLLPFPPLLPTIPQASAPALTPAGPNPGWGHCMLRVSAPAVTASMSELARGHCMLRARYKHMAGPLAVSTALRFHTCSEHALTSASVSHRAQDFHAIRKLSLSSQTQKVVTVPSFCDASLLTLPIRRGSSARLLRSWMIAPTDVDAQLPDEITARSAGRIGSR